MKGKNQAILHSKMKIPFQLKQNIREKSQEKNQVFSYQKKEHVFRILAT